MNMNGNAAAARDGPSPGPPRRGVLRGRSRRVVPLLAVALFAALSSPSTFVALGPPSPLGGGAPGGNDDPSFAAPAPTDPSSAPDPDTPDRRSLPSRVPSLAANATRGGTARRGGGMHVCACLAGDDPRNERLPPPPRRVRWLHVPKTGTSFVSTLWSYAASNGDRYIDLDISSHECGRTDNSSYSMYDFALMRRYPWEVYGAPNMIPASSPSPPSSSGAPVFDKNTPLGLVGGTQHTPLSPDLSDHHYATSRHYRRIRPKLKRPRGHEIFEHNLTVAAFFRRPHERLVSAYYDGRHASGFDPKTTWQQLMQASVPRKQRHQCTIDGRVYYNPLVCFARFPGIAGCMARMLTGEACADGILQEAGLENLPYAFDLIMNHLDFVGLTEEWNESVCQFHRLYMGRVDGAPGGSRRWDPPLQGEFSNVHKSQKQKRLGVEYLRDFRDLADAVVYEAARIKFERMVGGERCYRYVTFEELNGSGRHAAMPSLERDENGNVCRPMSCSDLGKQCGEWDDGCGKTVICGMCNIGRTGLPSTWRVRCEEGQCVDYCPPWDEKGYWSLSDDSPRIVRDLILAQDERHQKHLSPVDAVRICDAACADGGSDAAGMEPFVNSGLCHCGDAPKILKAGLALQDFSDAHVLNVLCKETKARKEAVLSDGDTQPICCPYIPLKPDLPTGWKRLYTIHGPNLEGEYFAHVRMECGSFDDCGSVAGEQGAEMAVFDLFNSMCYLARNVVDLEDAYTVTKDNQYRFMLDLRNQNGDEGQPASVHARSPKSKADKEASKAATAVGQRTGHRRQWVKRQP